MDKASKIKMIVGIVILVLAVGLIVYNMSSGGPPQPPPGTTTGPTGIG